MKKFIIYIVFSACTFIVISCHAQDTTDTLLSRSAVSLGGGVNITYPTLQTDFIERFTSVQPSFSLSYCFIFHTTHELNMGLTLGGGYVIYKYAQYISIGGLRNKHDASIIISKTDELFAGINLSKKISKGVYWYNEIDILESRISTTTINPPNKNKLNMYLFYRTGLTISIKRNVNITPLIRFPLLHIIPFDEQSDMLFAAFKPFNSIITGVLLTYKFNKE